MFYDLLDRKFIKDEVEAIEELVLKQINFNSIVTIPTYQKQDLVIETLLNLSEQEKRSFINLFPLSFSHNSSLVIKKTALKNFLFPRRLLGAAIGLPVGGLGRGLPSLQNSP